MLQLSKLTLPRLNKQGADLQNFIKPVGIGAGIGALGMGAADMLGNHEEEQEGERTPNLLKSMALGGVLGAGGGAMYQAGHDLLGPRVPGIAAQPPYASAWKGLVNPVPRTAVALGVGGQKAISGWKANSLATSNDKGEIKLDDKANFNAFGENDVNTRLYQQELARESNRLATSGGPGGKPLVGRGLSDELKKWEEKNSPANFSKGYNALATVRRNGQINRSALEKLIGQPGGNLKDFRGADHKDPKNFNPYIDDVDHPANIRAHKVRSYYGEAANQLEPWQKWLYNLKNSTIAPLRTAWDNFKGRNPYTVKSVDPIHVNPGDIGAGKMSSRFGLQDPNSGAYSKHMYIPKNKIMQAHVDQAVPRSFNRGYMYQAPLRGLATYGVMKGINDLATHHDAYQQMLRDPDFANKVLQEQSPEWQAWLKQKYGVQ